MSGLRRARSSSWVRASRADYIAHMTDPYRVLGVPRTADADSIRKAYKKLARKYHPDISKEAGAEDRFKEINAAYDIVGDAEKRKNWDQYGEASTRAGFDPNQGPFGGGAGGAGFHDMSDLFENLFRGGGGAGMGGMGGAPRARRGSDRRATLGVDFMMAVRGGETEISVREPDGSVDRLKVRIPAGVTDGGKLKVRGRGLPPRGGGPCGDLILDISIRAHAVLKRSGDDLEMEIPLTVLEAMQGTKLTVPTPTGDVKVSIPAGVKSGQRLRLKNRGIQKSVPGHLYLILQPAVPTSTDPGVLAAAQRLEEAYVGDIRGHLRV